MRRNIWPVLAPAALWNPFGSLGARKEDQDSLGEIPEYSDYLQPGVVQLFKCYNQVPGLGSWLGGMQGSQEKNAWPSFVSCLPCHFQPYNKPETGMSWDSSPNHSGLHHYSYTPKEQGILQVSKSCGREKHASVFAEAIWPNLLPFQPHTACALLQLQDSPSTSQTLVGDKPHWKSWPMQHLQVPLNCTAQHTLSNILKDVLQAMVGGLQLMNK